MSLKKILVKKKIKRNSKKGFHPDSDFTGRAGLIIDGRFIDDINDFLDQFKSAGFNADKLEILVCNAVNFQQDYKVISDGQINFAGRFKDAEVLELLKEPFDFLLCFFEENCYSGGLFSAKAKAALKIGKGWDTLNLFNLSIQTDDFMTFQQEAFKYLNILKNNN